MAPCFDFTAFDALAKATPKATPRVPAGDPVGKVVPELMGDSTVESVAAASPVSGTTYGPRPFAEQQAHAAASAVKPLPTPREALVQLAVAELYGKGALGRVRASEALREPEIAPYIDPKDMPHANTGTIETDVVENAVAKRPVVTEAVIEKALVQVTLRNVGQFRECVQADLDETVAQCIGDSGGALSALDQGIAKAVASGADGSPELVAELEAKKGAIEDAQMRAADLKLAEERKQAEEQELRRIAQLRAEEEAENRKRTEQARAAYEKAQEKVTAARAKEAAEELKFNTVRREQHVATVKLCEAYKAQHLENVKTRIKEKTKNIQYFKPFIGDSFHRRLHDQALDQIETEKRALAG